MIYPVLGLLAVSLLAFVAQLRKNDRFEDLINFFFFITIGAMLLVKLPAEETKIVWLFTAAVALNFVLSHINLFRRVYVRVIPPILTLIVVMTMMQGQTFTYVNESGVLINKFFVLAAVLAVVGYELAILKSKVFAKMFGFSNEADTVRALFILFMGAAIFFGGFQSGSIGIFALSAFVLSASFYRKNEHKEAITSLLPFVIIPILMHRANLNSAELTDFDVLEGLFYGAFSMFFVQLLWDAKKRNTLLIVLAYALGVGLTAILIILGGQFLKMGGMDAVLGAIVGASMVNMLVGKNYTGASFLPLLLSVGFIVPHFMPVNIEQQEIMAEMNQQTDSEVIEEIGKLEEIPGKYTIVEKESKVTFTLGEKGETKGAFREFSGEVIIADNPDESSLSITLNTKDLTTFNEIRDESVMSDEYLDESKFPTMTYNGTKLTSVGENMWEISGEFTMLGVSKPLNVTLQRLISGDNILIIGKGEIDRREFGMAPSSSEGNIVSFEYRALLK